MARPPKKPPVEAKPDRSTAIRAELERLAPGKIRGARSLGDGTVELDGDLPQPLTADEEVQVRAAFGLGPKEPRTGAALPDAAQDPDELKRRLDEIEARARAKLDGKPKG